MDDVCSCASVAEQQKTSQTTSSASDTVSSASQQALSQTHSQSQSQSLSQSQSQTQTASVGPHPGLSEAAFKRAIGETPPSADDLEKVTHVTHVGCIISSLNK